MDPASVLRIVLSILLSLALLLNATFLVFGLTHKIGTRLCSRLLRSQTLIDSLLMLANLINIQYFALFPVPAQSLSDSLWQAYCKLAYSEIVHWFLVSMSVYNLVCISIERCCCLCAPMWYKKHQALLVGIFIGIVLVSPFVVEVPLCLLVAVFVRADSNHSANLSTESVVAKRCEFTRDNQQMMRSFGVAYAVLFWALPSLLSVTLYLLILRKIRRSMALRKTSGANRDSSRNLPLSQTVKKLTLMTGVTSGAFVLLFAMDAIGFLLSFNGVHFEKEGVIDNVDSFLVNVNSAVNPLFYLLFLPEFRSFLACGAGFRRRRKPTASSACSCDDTGQDSRVRRSRGNAKQLCHADSGQCNQGELLLDTT